MSEPTDPRPGDRSLGVTLSTVEGESWVGWVERVGAELVEVRFQAADDAPEPDENEPVVLTFERADDEGSALSARGRLVSAIEDESDSPLLLFRFENPRKSNETLSPRQPLEDPTNRREAFRVRGENLEVTMRPLASGETSILRQLTELRINGTERTVQAALVDISVMGVGVLVRNRDAHDFSVGDHIDLAFELPSRKGPILLAGKVVYRLPVRIGTRYGLRFEEASARHLERLQRDILEYVMLRQREDLRKRTG